MIYKTFIPVVFLLICTFISSSVLASDHAGRLIRKSGDLEIFINPSNKVSGKGPHAKFEGKFYNVIKNPRLGFKIPNGSVVKTGKKSKARIIYRNGDQFNIGQGTSYVINFTSSKAKTAKSGVKLLFGKFRAIINKKGPRNNMKIRTNTAVMGIRGTDFFVDKKSSLKGAKVSVLRGVVELKPKKRRSKPVKIETGFSAQAPTEVTNKKSKVETVESVVVEKTSKQQLVAIQDQSIIKKEEEAKEKVSARLEKQLKKLEEKAVENTLEDIKDYDPTLYKKLKTQKVASIDQINSTVVKKVFVKAPSRPGKSDLENLSDENVYDKYFTIE